MYNSQNLKDIPTRRTLPFDRVKLEYHRALDDVKVGKFYQILRLWEILIRYPGKRAEDEAIPAEVKVFAGMGVGDGYVVVGLIDIFVERRSGPVGQERGKGTRKVLD